jgi:hypothetical protein
MNGDPAGTQGDGRERGQTSGQPRQPSDEQLRAAYAEELSRITSADLILQAAVSLLNIGGLRLGLATPTGEPAAGQRDLEQVRDAIDGVRALLVVIERARPGDARALRDALSQLQIAYAREAGAGAQPTQARAGAQPTQARAGAQPTQAGASAPSPPPAGSAGEQAETANGADGGEEPSGARRPAAPGPAETSGRLWVPGRR